MLPRVFSVLSVFTCCITHAGSQITGILSCGAAVRLMWRLWAAVGCCGTVLWPLLWLLLEVQKGCCRAAVGLLWDCCEAKHRYINSNSVETHGVAPWTSSLPAHSKTCAFRPPSLRYRYIIYYSSIYVSSIHLFIISLATFTGAGWWPQLYPRKRFPCGPPPPPALPSPSPFSRDYMPGPLSWLGLSFIGWSFRYGVSFCHYYFFIHSLCIHLQYL